MNCTRCDGTGFLNAEQVPETFDTDNFVVVLEWITLQEETDVSICDCCGNGETCWYGEPGQHYTEADPPGPNGPYSYNGGLCECH